MSDYGTSYSYWDDEEEEKKEEPSYWCTFGLPAAPPAEEDVAPAPPLPPPRRPVEPAPPPPLPEEHVYQLEVQILFADEPTRAVRHRKSVFDHPLRAEKARLAWALRLRGEAAALRLPLAGHSGNPVGGAGPPYRLEDLREVTREEYERLEGLVFWVEPYGAGAVRADAPGFAKGAVGVGIEGEEVGSSEGWKTREGKQKRVRTVYHQKRCAAVWVVNGPAAFIAEQMRENAAGEVVAELRKLNDEAERIYEEHLKEQVERLPGVTKLDLVAARHKHGWTRYGYRDYIEAMMSGTRKYERSEIAEMIGGKKGEYLKYQKLKDDAFWAWGKLVRPELYVTDSDSWGEAAASHGWDAVFSIYGDGEWDFKPVIGKVWGQRNRLGNSPAVYYYDVWSNLHYGYVGRAASLYETVTNLFCRWNPCFHAASLALREKRLRGARS